MDALLTSLGNQALNYAVRSGIAFTSSYAVQQCSQLLRAVNDRAIHTELKSLQKLLECKVKILSPSIDLIEFKSGRGNVFLESAVPLAKSLHREIVRLGKRLDDAATCDEALYLAGGGRNATMSAAYRGELMLIIKDIQALLARIDKDVPLILLAITNSGEKMNSAMSPGISPSRMMQASWFLNYADLQFAADPSRPVQVGPTFTLSLYMLFRGHCRARLRDDDDSSSTPDLSEEDLLAEEPYGLGEGDRKPIWQEVMHKARVRLCRTPMGWRFDDSHGYRPGVSPSPGVEKNYSATSAIAMFVRSDQYSYHLEVIEDLDDGRVHEDGPQSEPFDDMSRAGIRESIPIHQIAKIFYTDTGRLLNIQDAENGDNNPILLLKRDANAKTPTRLREEWFEDSDTSQSGGSNPSLAPLNGHTNSDPQLSADMEPPLGGPQVGREERSSNLPQHLDPEWLALEVYVDNDEDEDSEDEEELLEEGDETTPNKSSVKFKRGVNRSSVGLNLVNEIRRLSLQSGTFSGEVGKAEEQCTESHVARSPFGSVTTSLSLLEMLIRLTSLQEFQQTPHLAIPDHILTFFLDETSTTGLQGEAHWTLRKEAKRRMGFDPYTDRPDTHSK